MGLELTFEAPNLSPILEVASSGLWRVKGGRGGQKGYERDPTWRGRQKRVDQSVSSGLPRLPTGDHLQVPSLHPSSAANSARARAVVHHPPVAQLPIED